LTDTLTRLQRSTLVAEAFTPGGPIDDYALFCGRADRLQDALNAIVRKGEHVALYGERGVGKTSLANVLPDVLELIRPDTKPLAGKVNCGTDGEFEAIWKHVFRELGITDRPSQMTPEDVRYTLAQLGRPTIIVIDELDRLDNDETLTLIADTVKSLSDHAVPATLVLVGVADSVEGLIGEHASIVRNLVQIEMPRMSPTELAEIIERGCAHAQLDAAPAAVADITVLSEGLPHYTHLLALDAAQRVVMDDRTEITEADVSAAMPAAVSKHTLRSDYLKAVRSPRPVHLFREVLLACAFAPKDELGYFSPAAIRDPLAIITGRSLQIPAFSRHLKEFLSPERGSVLRREGLPRKYIYRFSDPIMQPYVILNGLSEGLISHDQVTRLRRVEGASTSFEPTSEPETLF